MLHLKEIIIDFSHTIEHCIPQMLSYFHHHRIQAQIFAFFVAFIEALPLIGTIVPGSITMTLLGILIGAKSIPFILTLLVASLGAYSGDILGFAFGHHYQNKLIQIWPFKKHPDWLTKSESFFIRHGRMSIIIGRFAGPIRSTVPLVAGILKMPWQYFLSAAAVAATLWSLVYLSPGIILGTLALTLPASAMAKFIGIGILGIFVIWFVIWIIIHFFTRLTRLFHLATERYWRWLNTHHHSHQLIRFITNRDQPEDHQQLLLLTLSLLGFICFGALLLTMAIGGPHCSINNALFHLIQSIRNPMLNTTAIFCSNLSYLPLAALTILLICCILFSQQQRAKAYTLFAAFIMAGSLAYISRHLFFSPRPTGFNYVKSSSSFVSGHCTMAVVLFGFWAYFSAPLLKKPFNKCCYWLAALLIFIIGFSRLLLGAHWFTDILGAWLLGLSVTIFMIMLFRRKHHHTLTIKPRYWFRLSALCLLIVWLPYTLTHYQHQRHQSQPLEHSQTISFTQWWNHADRYLPHYRANRFGWPSQPLNIQWQGKLKNIKQLLVNIGFHNNQAKPTLDNAVNNINKKSHYPQPLLPWLFHNKPAALLMTKKTDSNQVIIEIRLWKSFVFVDNKEQTVWVGSINFHAKTKFASLHSHYFDIEYRYKQQTPQQALAPLLQAHRHKVIQVTPNNKRKLLQKMQWDGNIILIQS